MIKLFCCFKMKRNFKKPEVTSNEDSLNENSFAGCLNDEISKGLHKIEAKNRFSTNKHKTKHSGKLFKINFSKSKLKLIRDFYKEELNENEFEVIVKNNELIGFSIDEKLMYDFNYKILADRSFYVSNLNQIRTHF